MKASKPSLSGGILVLLLAMIASSAYGRAGYQRTKDGNTLVWSSKIKSGERVTWSGDRDANGYATGPGTLISYPVERNFVAGSRVPSGKVGTTVASRYSGMMVEGKFEGPVTLVDTRGRILHAQFAGGEREGEWSAGPAPTPAPRARERAEGEAAVKGPSPSATPAPLEPAKETAVEGKRVETSPRTIDPLRSLARPPSTLGVTATTSASPQPSSSSMLNSAASAPSATADDARIVAALDTQYRAAVKENDAAAMDRILADDFVLVNGNGRVTTKADLIKEAQGKGVIYEHQEEREGTQKVRVSGDTAVVTAFLSIKGMDEGKPLDYQLWLSDTYIRTPAGWRDAFCQASLPSSKTDVK